MLPQTPSDTHRRVYDRGIAPLLVLPENAEDPEAVVDSLCFDLLETLLIPADLTNYPTSFGPADDDPLHPLRELAKKVDHKALEDGLVASGGKEALRAAYKDMKRYEGKTIVQRLKPIEPYRVSPFRCPIETALTARGIREATNISTAACPPPSMASLVLPSSRHFLTGYVKCEKFEVPKVSPNEALHLRWDVGAHAQEVKRVMLPALPPRRGLENTWTRWEAEETRLVEESADWLSPPIFTLAAAGPKILDFKAAFTWVFHSDPAVATGHEADDTPQQFLAMTMDDLAEDLDPLSVELLDEFDGVPFPKPSPSTRPSRVFGEVDSFRLDNRVRLPIANSMKDDDPLKSWRHSDALQLPDTASLERTPMYHSSIAGEDRGRPQRRLQHYLDIHGHVAPQGGFTNRDWSNDYSEEYEYNGQDQPPELDDVFDYPAYERSVTTEDLQSPPGHLHHPLEQRDQSDSPVSPAADNRLANSITGTPSSRGRSQVSLWPNQGTSPLHSVKSTEVTGRLYSEASYDTQALPRVFRHQQGHIAGTSQMASPPSQYAPLHYLPTARHGQGHVKATTEDPQLQVPPPAYMSHLYGPSIRSTAAGHAVPSSTATTSDLTPASLRPPQGTQRLGPAALAPPLFPGQPATEPSTPTHAKTLSLSSFRFDPMVVDPPNRAAANPHSNSNLSQIPTPPHSNVPSSVSPPSYRAKPPIHNPATYLARYAQLPKF